MLTGLTEISFSGSNPCFILHELFSVLHPENLVNLVFWQQVCISEHVSAILQDFGGKQQSASTDLQTFPVYFVWNVTPAQPS